MRKLFMFSGQGSQYHQMGAELYASEPVFRRQMDELDEVAAVLLGTSITGLLYRQGRRKGEPFIGTRLTGAAIFMVEVALARTLQARGVQPDAVLGASLGMMAAASVAGCLQPHEALRSVIAKAGILETHCPPGGMMAILADPQLYLNEPELHDRADLAGISSSSQFVVAAPAAVLPALGAWLAKREVAFQVLPVAQAFHSRWIDAARPACEAHFAGLPLQPAKLPLFCCAAQGPSEALSVAHLWRIIRDPIHLDSTVAALEAQGPWHYIDAGPGSSLATLLKYRLDGRSGSRTSGVLNPFGGELRYLEQAVQAAGLH